MKHCVGAALLLLAGCDNPAIDGCETFIKDGLRSPSTYKRISVRERDLPISRAELQSLGGARGSTLAAQLRRVGRVQEANRIDAENAPASYGLHTVDVTYEASNAFGVPIRDRKICAFETRDGVQPSSATIQRAVADAKDVREISPDPKEHSSREGYDCCFR